MLRIFGDIEERFSIHLHAAFAIRHGGSITDSGRGIERNQRAIRQDNPAVFAELGANHHIGTQHIISCIILPKQHADQAA